ncbi:MAG: hypothetical protein AAFN50_04525 [Pseudomonadota bacterium]
MNSEIHPAIASLVLVTTVAAIVLWMWASGTAASFGGPAELNKSPDGRHYVQIQNYLVEHDQYGNYLATHDLDAYDVDVFLGGFAFFSNGDVLFRRGPDPRTFLDNIRAYQRKANLESIVPEDVESGLFRCRLNAVDCERFGEAGIDFKAAYSVFIDWQTDEVYISDTTRHVLRKYSSKGVELAAPAGGFKFPNQLMLHDGQVVVADTNHHVIRRLTSESDNYAEIVDSKDVVPHEASAARRTWPSHFARVGDSWWVNNMRTGMNEGGIYVFDDDWNFAERVALPPDADPISILAVGDTVWVSDWNNDVVRRFSRTGEPLSDLESEGFEEILDKSRQERFKFTALSYVGFALVAGMFIVLINRALVRGPVSRSVQQDSLVGESASADNGVLHMEPDEKQRKRMARSMWLVRLVVGAAMLSVFFMFDVFEKPDAVIILAAPLLGLFVVIQLVAWASRGNWTTSIEVDGDTLILRDYSGRLSRCPIREVRYDDNAIATRDAVVILGRPQARVYKQSDIEERLMPRLAAAQNVGAFGMLKVQVELRHPQGIFVLVATVAALVALGVMQLAS